VNLATVRHDRSDNIAMARQSRCFSYKEQALQAVPDPATSGLFIFAATLG